MDKYTQRYRIADALGIKDARWTPHGLLENRFMGWVGPDDNTGKLVPVPDYLNDLNAMHEVEKILTPEQRLTYLNCLHCMSELRSAPFATAAQRAEAFLKTINKWED